MADKKSIEISFEDNAKAQGLTADSQSAQAEDAARVAREKEEREFQKLRNEWLRQYQQDKEELENFFVESTKRQWEREAQEAAREKERAGSLDSFDDLISRFLREGEKKLSREDADAYSIYGGADPDDSALLDVTQSADELTEQIDKLTGGTKQAAGGLGGFVQGIGRSITALVGGGGGGGGGGVCFLPGAAGGAAGGVGMGLAGAAGAAGAALLAVVGGAIAFDRVVNSLVEQVGGFSGEVVQASVRSRLQELEDRMRLARDAGDEIADLERSRSDINSELRGIVREGVDLLGPVFNSFARFFLETPLAAIRTALERMNDAVDYLAEGSDLDRDIALEGNAERRRVLEEIRRQRREREKY